MGQGPIVTLRAVQIKGCDGPIVLYYCHCKVLKTIESSLCLEDMDKSYIPMYEDLLVFLKISTLSRDHTFKEKKGY